MRQFHAEAHLKPNPSNGALRYEIAQTPDQRRERRRPMPVNRRSRLVCRTPPLAMREPA